MNIRPALLTGFLSAAASVVAAPSFAATSNNALDSYFLADSAISVAMLVVAASGLAVANLLGRQRTERLARAQAYARASQRDNWQRVVYQNLEADLQDFTYRFRQAA